MFGVIIAIIVYLLLIKFTFSAFEAGEILIGCILIAICIAIPLVAICLFYTINKYEPDKKEKIANRAELINIIFDTAAKEGEIWHICITSHSFKIRNKDGSSKIFSFSKFGYSNLQLNSKNAQKQFKEAAEKRGLEFKISKKLCAVKSDAYTSVDSGNSYIRDVDSEKIIDAFIICSKKCMEFYNQNPHSLKKI